MQAKILSLLGSNAVVPSPSSSQGNQVPGPYKSGAPGYATSAGQYNSYGGGRDAASGPGGGARGGEYSGGYGYRGYQ